MNRDLVGVGSSVSRDKDCDSLDTLLFSRDNDIKIAQIYLDYNLINKHNLIEEVREFAKINGIRLTCHSPEMLNEKTLSKSIISAANELLIYQKEKKIIIHFDENENLKDSLANIEELNRNELTVCLENFYNKKDEVTFLKNISAFNSIFSHAGKYALPLYPVIDFPRLFISDIIGNYDSLSIAKQIIDNLARYSIKIILHLIDFLDYSQERDCWCVLGKGLMPYGPIFEFARKRQIIYDHCILEYEEKGMFLESLSEIENI